MTQQPEKPPRTVIQFRCSAKDIAEFKEAAERAGHVSLTAWIMFTLRKEVRESRPPK